MIITKTASVDGYRITEYNGVVFGEIVAGVDFLRDLAAGLSNFFGGRSGSYENELIQAREAAIREMAGRASQMGADAIVSVTMDYEVIGSNGSNMMMVIASGTPVKLARE